MIIIILRYGTPLVESCIRSKTHMTDLTAEVHWVLHLVKNYHERAEKAGAKIVNFCGFEVSTYIYLIYSKVQLGFIP